MIAPAAALEDLDRLGLDEAVSGLYLHENARRVFKLPAPAGTARHVGAENARR
jgi:predicted TIM-barrel fold metal-dependent hydrolase